MGADGGTIPRRDELVKEKKKPEKKDKTSELQHKWNDCSISQLPLQKPVMACEYGSLYNKESVLECLLDKQKYEGVAKLAHIRGLKDVKELQLTDNPALSRTDNKMDISNCAPYICPVTGLEMNGKHRFCFIWTCGCVISERALKEVPSSLCHKCAKPYAADDVIVLNGDDADFELMKSRMEERRLAAKQSKKGKKKAKTDSEGEPSSKAAKLADKGETSLDKSKLKSATAAKLVTAASSAAKTVKSKSLSVQDDPKSSEVYKSLFTSSDEAKKQGAQHSGWVSFNPQYFR
ncbi:RTFDC1 [Bugula neritina]|uniref:Replication termination factor 2 n=1 Tax=Bugula neritina TaxID=10212 RepID=A0A7J7JXW3_BUGNE|nr:RTFDC1 [Bugula neritina]KAF6037576.1 RTFDC1 [Bugula neritina]